MSVFLKLSIGILIYQIWIGYNMGKLVLSIDFELRWGVLDRVGNNVKQYQENIISVHETLPWMLKVFEERNVAATWATVGALGCENWEEFEQARPKIKPSYLNSSLNYINDFNQKIDPEGKLYFAPRLIEKIIKTKAQELGTHTFGHIYATEPNVTYKEFKEDILTAKSFLSKKFGRVPVSLVYPRNQVIYPEQLIDDDVMSIYRGNEDVDYLSAENQKAKRPLNRAKILIDALAPWISHQYPMHEIENGNVKSSAMFRIQLRDGLRQMHLFKLKQNIKQLREEEVYHIWYHPHNLSTSAKKKDDFVRFFDFVGDEIAKGKLDSESMGSIYKLAKG